MAVSQIKAIRQFLFYKKEYSLGAQEKELLLDFIAELFGKDKEDIVEAINREIWRKQNAELRLSSGPSSSG